MSVSSATSTATKPATPKFDIASDEVKGFHHDIKGLVTQYHALVELESLADRQKASMRDMQRRPLAERLNEYPIDEIDLTRLVNFPPKLQPVPVKPLFLDLAWNYIDYPGRSPSTTNGASKVAAAASGEAGEKAKSGSRGWFGFGR